MPQTLTAESPVYRLEEDDIAHNRKRWTRDECRRLMETDILPEGHWELIDGDIIWNLGQNEPHIYVSTMIFEIMIAWYGFSHVRLPAPVAVDDFNEPEPDISVTIESRRYFLSHGTPKPTDLRLAVEVSDSTLRRDLSYKMLLYARAGIPEYWVVDINARKLHVFREPTPEGYTTRIVVKDDEFIAPQSSPHPQIQVRDILP